MNVVVLSREIIKPSFPTPPHLRSFKLSFLDQFAPPFYIPFIYYYPNNDDNNTIPPASRLRSRCTLIRKSLSETLTRFYPLAGRIKFDSLFIDCNDDGVEFLEARVNNFQRLSQVIQHPNVAELERTFLPFDPYSFESSGFNSKVLLGVQVNIFEDGMVIGLNFSHKIGDAPSMISFTNHWAATTRGVTEQVKGPELELSTLFPPKEEFTTLNQPSSLIKSGEIVTKKFVFGPSKIAELKKKAITTAANTDNNRVLDDVQAADRATSVEVVTALIWKCFMDVHQKKRRVKAVQVYGATTAVSIRKNMIPSMPPNAFGNLCSMAVALSIIDDDGEKDQYPNLVAKVRQSIKKIDTDHVREVQTTKVVDYFTQLAESFLSGQILNMHFSSLCRVRLYEADFGWGRPIWLSSSMLAMENLVYLLDTSSGDGIEALVSLTKEDMAEFERKKELLQFISVGRSNL